MNTENNKLIAEFLGYELEEILSGKEVYAIEGLNNNLEFFYPNELLYHSDWNWLMYLVEKIFQTAEDEKIEDEIEIGILLAIIRDSFYAPKKEYVYNCCLDFINYYNKQKN